MLLLAVDLLKLHFHNKFDIKDELDIIYLCECVNDS